MRLSTAPSRTPPLATSAGGVDRRVLTRRYVLALSIIGIVLLGQHGLTSLQVGKHKSDGALINAGGVQRMLSQRIAMLTNEIANASSDFLRERRIEQFSESLLRMETVQAELLEDWEARAAAGDVEFASLLDDTGVAIHTENFLILARTVQGNISGSDTDQLIARNTAMSLSAIARGEYLQALDEMVLLYERLGRESIERLQSAGTLAILIGLSVLVAVSGLIFRPMVDLVVDTIDSLRDARDEQYELGRRMSHDLRSPIASSLGVLAILDESLEEGDVEQAKEATRRLDGALNRLDEVLARLMAVTRLHRVEPDIEPFDLDALLTETLDENGASDCVTVRNELDVPIITDRTLLKGILQALVENAVAYRQGCNADIVVTITQGRGEVQVSVDDRGIGIPEQCRARVFDMFQKFHPERSSGVGLGLYLTKISARALCGSVEYQPLSQGSRFMLTLPHRKAIAA